MSNNRIVNALTEALDNAPGPNREPAEVGQLLAYCQQECSDWSQPGQPRGCGRYDLGGWIRVMVTPGAACDQRGGPPS